MNTRSNGLRYTKAKVELIKGIDLFQMFKNGIRGAITGVFEDRCIKSDNSHKILYMDQNNLYGHAMS